MLKDKVAVVTGSSRGIGRAITKAYAQEGAKVYAVIRKPGSLDDLLAEVEKKVAGEVIPVCFDVRDAVASKEGLLQIYKDSGKIDILVNNAGIMEDALIGMISDEMMLKLFETNVYPVIRLTQLAARFMIRKKTGAVINMASIIGAKGNAGQSVYAATKGAVISFTKSAAKELTPSGVRVNAIAPGIINTDLLQDVPEELLEKRVDNIKLGRVGTPEEVAQAAVFLASEKASYISGQVIGIDGCAVL